MISRLFKILLIVVTSLLSIFVYRYVYAQVDPGSVGQTTVPTTSDTQTTQTTDTSASTPQAAVPSPTTEPSTTDSQATKLTEEIDLLETSVVPGDLLYQPKRWLEGLSRGLTNLLGSEESQLRQQVGYANLRLTEAVQLIDENDQEKQTKHLEPVLNEYKNDTEEVITKINQKLDQGDEGITVQTRLIEELKANSAKQLAALQFASTHVSGDLESVLTNFTDIASRAAAVVADTIGDDPISEEMINHLTELGVDNKTLEKLASLNSRLGVVEELRRISVQEGQLSQSDILNSLSFEVPKYLQDKFKAINTVKAVKDVMASSVYFKPTKEQEEEIKKLLSDSTFKPGETTIPVELKPFIETQLRLAKYMNDVPMAMLHLNPTKDFAARPNDAEFLLKIKTEIEQKVGKDLENLPADQKTFAGDLMKKVTDIYQNNFYDFVKQSRDRGDLGQFIDPTRISAPGLGTEDWKKYLSNSGLSTADQKIDTQALNRFVGDSGQLGTPPTWVEPPKEFINSYSRYLNEDVEQKQANFFEKHYQQLKESGVLEKRADQYERYHQNQQENQKQTYYQQPNYQGTEASSQEEVKKIERYERLLQKDNVNEVIQEDRKKFNEVEDKNRQNFQEQLRQGDYYQPVLTPKIESNQNYQSTPSANQTQSPSSPTTIPQQQPSSDSATPTYQSPANGTSGSGTTTQPTSGSTAPTSGTTTYPSYSSPTSSGTSGSGTTTQPTSGSTAPTSGTTTYPSYSSPTSNGTSSGSGSSGSVTYP